MPLCEIRTMHIQQMHNSLELSSKYQHCIHAILSNIFEIAVQDDLIVKNPCCHTYFLPFCMTAMQFIEFRSAYFNFVSEWYHIEYLSTQSTIIYNRDYLYWFLWCFPWFQLAYWLLRLTALAFSLILACLSASSGDCFGAFADSSLPIGFFGWPLWGFRWFQLAYWAISVDCFDVFANSSLLIGLFGWLLWRFRWFRLAY